MPFLQEVNATVYKRVPGVVTIAEESTAWPGVTRPTHLGGLGFGFKWNMGWMHDSLGYISSKDPVHRQYHHHQMTFSMMYAYSENYVLPHVATTRSCTARARCCARCPATGGSSWPTCAPTSAFMWAHPGKQLLFMGCEIGQESEWAEAAQLDWWLLDTPTTAACTTWSATSTGSTATRRRCGRGTPTRRLPLDRRQRRRQQRLLVPALGQPDGALACVANFAGVPHEGYRVGLPYAGHWDEVLNTDAETYTGSGVGNLGAVEADSRPGTASRRRSRCGCRRSATLGLRFAPPTLDELAPAVRPSRRPCRCGSEQNRHQVAACRGHPRILCPEHGEELEQVGPCLLTVIAARPADQRHQPATAPPRRDR